MFLVKVSRTRYGWTHGDTLLCRADLAGIPETVQGRLKDGLIHVVDLCLDDVRVTTAHL